MSAATDITHAGLVAHEAAGKAQAAARDVADASRQLALNTESLQQERQRWQHEVLPELRAVSAEILAGFAALAEIRQKAGAAAGEPGLGIALAQAEERTVASSPDHELIERAVRSAGYRRRRAPRWVHVKEAFGLGGTYSSQLCRRFGLDPDEECGTEVADGD